MFVLVFNYYPLIDDQSEIKLEPNIHSCVSENIKKTLACFLY